jgi:transcriptional regulator with XRE-family HTH domain
MMVFLRGKGIKGFEISKQFHIFASIKDMDIKPLIERLAALIHTLRERGVTNQGEIAARLSISDGQLSSQLSGRNSPSVGRAEAIAGATGHYLELLLLESDSRIRLLQSDLFKGEGFTDAEVVDIALFEMVQRTGGFLAPDRIKHYQEHGNKAINPRRYALLRDQRENPATTNPKP